jgi:hypothetical protein
MNSPTFQFLIDPIATLTSDDGQLIVDRKFAEILSRFLLTLEDIGLRLFPDLRWGKEVRWERTAMKARRSGVKLGG